MGYNGKLVSIIMAANDRGVIGYSDGTLPWHDPEDLKWFKSITDGRSIIFGRVTAEKLPPLPNREVFVVSNSRSCLTLEESITVAASKEVFIGGGATLYKSAMPYVDRFYISRVNAGAYAKPYLVDYVYSPFILPWDFSAVR